MFFRKMSFHFLDIIKIAFLWALVLNFSCDTTNLFKPLADKSSDKALLEEAKVALDQEDYPLALSYINQIKGDTNEKRLTHASAILGAADLGILDLANRALSAIDSSASDSFFDALASEIDLGTGEEENTKTDALNTAINLLVTAPETPTKGMLNLGCILSGILAIPSAVSALSAMTSATENLSAITSSVNGTGATRSQCPGIEEFEENLSAISLVQRNFATILETVDSCPILNISGSQTLNTIEQTLTKLTNAADQGCQTVPTCDASDAVCQALGLGCMASLFTTENVLAQDGEIATCEIVQNCLNPSDCF